MNRNMAEPKKQTFRRWIYGPISVLLVALVLGFFIRLDTYLAMQDTLSINYNYAREGAAISFSKGWGLKIYPIPDYRKTGKNVHPEEYLQWDEVKNKEIDPKSLDDLLMNPGPSILLGMTYKVFGLNNNYYKIIQLVVTWLCIFGFYYVGRTVLDSSIGGAVTALLYAVTPFDAMFSMTLGREIHTNVGIVLLLSGLAYVVSRERSATGRLSVTSLIAMFCVGMVLGSFVYFKGTVVPLIAMIPLVLIFYMPIKRVAALTLVAWVGVAIVLAPGVARMHAINGQFSVGKEAEFLAVWGGIGYNANPIGLNATDTGSLSTAAVEIVTSGQELKSFYMDGAYQYDKASRDLFIRYVTAHPATYALSVLKNTWQNATNYTEWPYYDFRHSTIPPFYVSKFVLEKVGLIKILNPEYFVYLWIFFITYRKPSCA